MQSLLCDVQIMQLLAMLCVKKIQTSHRETAYDYTNILPELSVNMVQLLSIINDKHILQKQSGLVLSEDFY